MLRSIITAGATAIATTLFTANQAAAFCFFGIFGTTCSSGSTGTTTTTTTGTAAAAPEFDGPGAVAAVALIVSVGALMLYRARR